MTVCFLVQNLSVVGMMITELPVENHCHFVTMSDYHASGFKFRFLQSEVVK